MVSRLRHVRSSPQSRHSARAKLLGACGTPETKLMQGLSHLTIEVMRVLASMAMPES